MREQIKKDNPGISITEITKKAGEMWKEVSDKSVSNESIYFFYVFLFILKHIP